MDRNLRHYTERTALDAQPSIKNTTQDSLKLHTEKKTRPDSLCSTLNWGQIKQSLIFVVSAFAAESDGIVALNLKQSTICGAAVR